LKGADSAHTFRVTIQKDISLTKTVEQELCCAHRLLLTLAGGEICDAVFAPQIKT